jgi:hypothetical protein
MEHDVELHVLWQPTPPSRTYWSFYDAGHPHRAALAVVHGDRMSQLPFARSPSTSMIGFRKKCHENESVGSHMRWKIASRPTHCRARAAVPDAVLRERLRDRARGRLELRAVDDARAARQVARVHELGVARLEPVDRLDVLGGAQRAFERIDPAESSSTVAISPSGSSRLGRSTESPRLVVSAAQEDGSMGEIEVGYQAFVSDGDEEFGAIREVHPDHIVVYVENAGDFRAPGCGEGGALGQGDLRLRAGSTEGSARAIGHAHDAEVPGL